MRSWALQEALLSRCMFRYTRSQLYWECCSVEVHEVLCNGNGLSTNSQEKVAGLSPSSSVDFLRSSWSKYADKVHPHQTHEPTIGHLGNSSKNAWTMHLNESDYLAGLDERQPYSRNHVGSSRPESSLKAGEVLCAQLETETFPIGDPYGQVSGAYLRVRGILCQQTVIR